MDTPSTRPRAVTAVELKAQIEAERNGEPFLVLRDGSGEQRLVILGELGELGERILIGRDPPAELVLDWDGEVSRVHAELLRTGREWTLFDDGLSLNGTFVNEAVLRGRRRLHDGDVLRLGDTILLFRDPGEAESRATTPSGQRLEVALSESQRRVLVALCRPFKNSSSFVTPATNEQIAAELFLSVDAVKKHMRVLFEKFGVEQLPQYEKRARLVERAFAVGSVSEHEL